MTNLRASLGTANLALDGQIDERMNLRFAFTTQDLSLLAAGSRGQVKASGTLGGTLQEPSLVGVAHAANVDYAGIKLKGDRCEHRFRSGRARQGVEDRGTPARD